MSSRFIAYLIVRLAFMAIALLVGRYPARHIRPTWARWVKGRRTGLSEHASPFGQTERRAKRTLDRAPP